VPQTKGSEVPQGLKHINGVADVAKENVIESLARLEHFPELVFVRESDCEVEGRISLSCDLQHLGANVDAFTAFWTNCSPVVTGAATNRQHRLIRFDHEAKQSS